MRKPVKVKFVDFWTKDVEIIWLYHILKKHFNVEFSDEPDVLVYSVFGYEHLNYNCKKICFITENTIPDYSYCDYSIGFNYDESNPRHLRYPLFLFYKDVNELIKTKTITTEDIIHKDKFCVFIVSNPKANERKEFFTQLNEIKRVDSAGKVLNNMPDNWQLPDGEKLNFLKRYRFNIAFENSSAPGYTTEKIFEPMFYETIPIYWGDPLVYRDFNPRSFINVMDYPDYKSVIDYVMEVENNQDLYLKILNEPLLVGNVVPEHLKFDRLLEFLERALYEKIAPVSQKPKYILSKAKMKTQMLQEQVAAKLRSITK